MKRMMKLSDIKIKQSYLETIPSKGKMDECRKYWKTHSSQDRYIVVDHDDLLIDGYIQYLILKENNIEEAEIKIWHCKRRRWFRKNVENCIPTYRKNPTTYIFGVHPNSNCKREFCWRVPNSWINWADNIQIGDTIICSTKNGYAPVVVNKIEILDKCPIDIPVKKVCNKKIRRNGIIVGK